MKKKNEKAATQESKRAPVHTAKAGAVQASVFLNKTKDGKEFASAVISRRYQGKDGNWKSSDSYATISPCSRTCTSLRTRRSPKL